MNQPLLTAGIGNLPAAGSMAEYLIPEPAGCLPLDYFAARWDGDKIRGLSVRCAGQREHWIADFGNPNYILTSYRFVPGELLTKAWLRDSGYGYGSLRQIEFQTTTGGVFKAGAAGFDHEVALPVFNAMLVGVKAWVNPDNFMQGLALYIYPPKS